MNRTEPSTKPVLRPYNNGCSSSNPDGLANHKNPFLRRSRLHIHFAALYKAMPTYANQINAYNTILPHDRVDERTDQRR